MPMDPTQVVTGVILDNDCTFTLAELSRTCSAHAEYIIELVEEGIIEPIGRQHHHWYFTGEHLLRARKVQRLQQDLGVNLAGAAVVLELMDEIEQLRGQLRLLNREG